MRQEHPAKIALNDFNKRNPQLHKVLDEIALAPRPAGLEIPDHILLPDEVWRSLYMYTQGIDAQSLPPGQLKQMQPQIDEAMIMALWGKTQGIYRFDQDIYQELTESPLDGDIPAQLLRQMPEWCIFVETPGLSLSQSINVDGLWIANGHSLGPHGSQGHTELHVRMLFDHKLPFDPTSSSANLRLPLDGSMTIQELLDKHVQNTIKTIGPAQAMAMKSDIDATRDLTSKALNAAVNLTLFICTQNDLRNEKGQQQPTKPTAQRTKNGPRLFMPNRTTTWDVGTRMGSAIRAAQTLAAERQSTGLGGTVRPHIRRAHWHSFRTGKTKTADGQVIPAHQRDLTIKWMPSIPVNLPEDMPVHELPAVIHRAASAKSASQVSNNSGPSNR